MKFSEKWLREWVNPNVSHTELVDQLTMLGLEVDEVLPASGDFSNVYIAEIIKAEKHPDADKLKICTVDVGLEEKLQIVCGAPNAKVGLKAPLAKIGALLPGNFKIKKSKLRGIESFGMLCSQVELGLSDDHSGLFELPDDAPVGQCIRKFMNLDDAIIDVDLTPNRADCFCLRGIARDVACLNKLEFKEIEFKKQDVTIQEVLNVNLNARKECPRYLSRVINQVDLSKKSPLWMQEKLRRSGVRPISVAVDVTNYVMMELGQPMHAFDKARLNGSINVQMANKGEKITLLDEKEIMLDETFLMISDDQDHLAIAGIMGGLDSGVSSSTKDIVLESAYFNPSTIMGKTRDIGVFTESALRFERGVDHQLQATAMERATQLIVEICGGDVGPIHEVKSEEDLPKAKEIVLTKNKVSQILGFDIDLDEITRIFNSLGLISKVNNDTWVVQSNSYRFDVEIAEDLVEEIVRIVGYDQMPSHNLISEDHIIQSKEEDIPNYELKSRLNHMGYMETINYSFVSNSDLENLGKLFNAKALSNPLTEEFAFMRTSLLPGLLKTLNYNLRRQNPRLKIYESGNVFEQSETLVETDRIIAAWTGSKELESWNNDKSSVDFFDLKGDLERLLETTHGDVSFIKSAHSFLHPGRQSEVLINNDSVGWLGQIHPRTARLFGIKKDVYVFELNINYVNSSLLPEFQSISKFPTVRRDLALVVNDVIKYSDIKKLVSNEVGDFLSELIVFDEYKGDNLEAGTKSLAIGIILQNKKATFEDKDVDKLMSKVVSSITSNLHAEIRGG